MMNTNNPVMNPKEIELYVQCAEAVKEKYPNHSITGELIRDCYDNNRNPDMRSSEEIGREFGRIRYKN
jgi:hypothetical protein